jgi:hypothetical protein
MTEARPTLLVVDEAYVSRHTDAQFSHGICPECMEKLYPEFCKKKGAALVR